MTPLMGFAPDMEATSPGVITDCEQFIPYIAGMEAAPSPANPPGVPALAADCRGSAILTKLDGTRRVFAGTQTDMYELSSGGTWTDVSRATNYNGIADTRWSFAQFGNAALCSNKEDVIQRSLSTGIFADIASAPKAEIIFSVGTFVMALNTDFGSSAWHCCGTFDETTWTPSLLTQAARGLLVASPGKIIAGAALGEYAVAYKNRSMYLGQYVGSPSVWDWLLVPGGETGCIGKEALCDIGGAHFFVGLDNFWIFDGTRPQPVGNDVIRQWFFDNSASDQLYKTKCVFDRQQNRVWIFYPKQGATVCDSALVYHVKTQKWGRANRTVQAAVNYITAAGTYDTFNNYGATFDTLPNIPLDSQYFLEGGQTLSFFNATNQLQSLVGAPEASSFTTGDTGDDQVVTLLQQIRLRYAAGKSPTTATGMNSYKFNSGENYTAGTFNTLNDGKFDLLQSARWHKARFDFTGICRVTGVDMKLKPNGTR